MKSLFIFFLFFAIAFYIDITPIAIDKMQTDSITVYIEGDGIDAQDLTLPMYATIEDALEKLELSDNVDLSSLNPNQILHDKDVINIPQKQEEIITKVSINTSSLEQLQTIPGIGPSTASKIIAYREENGLFQSIEDIMLVKGIGEAKYEKIKDHITL